MFRIFRGIAPLFAFILTVSSATGQVATGVYPYGTFDQPGIDTINVGNLNVHLSLPVLNKPGRGLPFSASLAYDSSVYYPTGYGPYMTWSPTPQFGWNASTGVVSGQITYSTNSYVETYWVPYQTWSVEVNCYYNQYANWAYRDSGGINHPLGTAITSQFSYQDNYPNGWTCPDDSFSSTSGTATDGSGYKLAVSSYTTASITANNGLDTYNPGGPSTLTDTNGNQISSDGSGHFTDTTGNVVLTVSGSMTTSQLYTYNDSSGNPQHVSVNYGLHPIQTNFGCGIGEYSNVNAYLVDSIAYPDGSTYHFSYESTPGYSGKVTGRLAGIQLPQGGWITYAYSGGHNGINCSDGSTAGLTRSISGSAGSAASSVSYSRTLSGTLTTTVVDGLNNSKVYTFVSFNNFAATAQLFETARSIYQGAASGTPVIARTTCYNYSGSSSPCSSSGFSQPVTQIDTYESINGGPLHGSKIAIVSSSGMGSELDVYDFGTSGTRGSLLAKETRGYGAYYPGYATEDDVYDGSGTQVGRTGYNYDESTPAVSSGIPHHVSVSSARENLTSIHQYATAGTSYTTTMTYEDTGSMLTSQPPSGTTTLGYDSYFVCPTSQLMPATPSGVTLQSHATCNSHTGLPATVTDFNGNVTTFYAYDSMLRPTDIRYPDGGRTTFSYSPTQVGQQVYQTSSTYSDSETVLDGYGRLSRTAVATGANGSGPWYLQDTCYDANGNVSYQSYPYQSSSLTSDKVCSGSGDSYSHDVLRRLTSLARSNGETQSVTYNGRATKVVDANNVTRISQVDGLGRISIVCEISSNSSMPGSGSPVSCGTDIGGTGFTTTYSYSMVSVRPNAWMRFLRPRRQE